MIMFIRLFMRNAPRLMFRRPAYPSLLVMRVLDLLSIYIPLGAGAIPFMSLSPLAR